MMVVAMCKTQSVVHVWHCCRCAKIIGEYCLPVAYYKRRCHHCGEWNELIDGVQNRAA